MILQWGEYSLRVYWLLAGLLVAFLAQYVVLKGLDRFIHRRKWFDQEQHVSKFLRHPLLAWGSFVAIDESVTGLSHISERLYIVLTVWLLIRLTAAVKSVAYHRLDTSTADNLRVRKIRTQFQFLEKTTHVVLILIGVALLLMTYSEVRALGSSIIASAGLAGIAVGFAAQRTLGTFVSGFQVAFTQPIRLDDVVIVEGEWGIVEEITFTYVVLRIWDLRRLIVPINYFTEKTFQNWTRTSSSLLAYVFLSFDYSVSIDDLRKEFIRILTESKLWDKKVAIVQVTDTTEKAMQLRFLTSARNAPEAFDLRCELREKLITFAQKNMPESLPRNRISFHDDASGAAIDSNDLRSELTPKPHSTTPAKTMSPPANR
jgi:small-conductance mechanosensitive channel